jgi:probable HAF family extracellular repeat protein
MSRCGSWTPVWLLVAVFSAAATPSQADPSFSGLGEIPGGRFSVYAISADGLTVVGRDTSASGTEATVWTRAGGFVGLGHLAGGSFSSTAEGVSDDGSTIVGGSSSASGSQAFRRTSATMMVGLGDLADGGFSSGASDVSADGSVIVGFGTSASGTEAFRWTSGGGMVGLGDIAGGSFSSNARAVSADGSVVAGRGEGVVTMEAFRWTSGTGMVGLGLIPGSDPGPGSDTSGRGISADGSTIVGEGSTGFSIVGFRWTSGTGVVNIGGNLTETASGDGSLVVGFSGVDASIWDAQNGMRPVAQVLTDLGLDLTGWTLSEAWAITDDGRVIAGDGTNPDGQPESWIAVLSDPPADPSTLPALGPFAIGLLAVLLGLAGGGRLRVATRLSRT